MGRQKLIFTGVHYIYKRTIYEIYFIEEIMNLSHTRLKVFAYATEERINDKRN